VPGAVLQRSLNLESVGGTVAVVPAGSTGALPLLEEDLVPLGSTIDARTGSALVNVRRTSGTLEPARAFDGLFSVSQTATDITDLSLTGPLGCPAGTRRSVASASAFGPVGDPLASITKKKRKKARFKRRLWVESKGKYRIKGRYVSALERGTKWRVRDACDRSEVRVDEGSVRVRNLVTGKKRIVTGPATFVVFAR
jgi:hypothetical protein